MDIVSALRRAVADRVGRERFHLWFGESAQFLWDGVRVFVIVPNQFYLDWLRTRFRKHVDEGCAAVLGYSPPIDFRLKPPTKTDSRPSLFAQPEVLQANLRLDGSHPPVTSRQGRQATAVTLDDGAASQSRSDEGLEDRSSRGNSADSVLESTDAAASRPTVPTACPEVIAVAANANANDSGIKAGPAAVRNREPRGETARPSNSGRTASRLTSDGQRTKPPVQHLLFPMDDEPGETRSEVIAASASGSGMSARDWNASGGADAKDVSPVAPEILAHCDEKPDGDGTPSGTASRSKVAWRGRKFADLRDFVVGRANQLAFAAAETVVRHLGEYSPLTIYGPTGTGKTHLLEGVWSAVRQRHRHLPAIYLSAEQFTSAFIDAVKGGGVAALRMKYRGVRLLILDDLQFFRGKRQTQIELLYTIDALLKNGSQVICAADRSPQELGELGSELISRLQSGMVCRLDPPDAAMRMEIVSRSAAAVNLNLSESVCRWLSQRLSGDVRQLTGAVCRLKAFAETPGAVIGRTEAEEVLADLLASSSASSSAEVPIEEIELAVCRTLGLPDKSLHANTKDRRISGPRMLAMWLARKYTRAPLNEIGRYFGKKSHATVISAQKRVDQWLAESAELRADRRKWKVADVIEEVHRQLRAG
mgnify:CR=1 FL=1